MLKFPIFVICLCHYTDECRGVAHSVCNLKYSAPKVISIVFHFGSIYEYHFIIKELAEKSEGQFNCLGEYAEKYIASLVPIKKEVTDIDKNGDQLKSYILETKIFGEFDEGIHKIKCTNCNTCYLEYKT